MRRCMTDKQLLPCSYSMSFYLFRAMEQLGVYDEFPEKWTLWQDLLPYHLTTWPEDTVSQRSDCHGWSAVPLYELVSMVIGLQPASPGGNTLCLRPVMCAWAVCRSRCHLVDRRSMCNGRWM